MFDVIVASVEVAHQRTPSVLHGGGGERGNVARKAKGTIKPEFEPHTDQVGAVLLDEARLAVEMGKASLVVQPMSLLAGIAIRYPDVGLVAGHRVANDLGGAAEHGGMDDGIGRAEHPLIAVAAFDPLRTGRGVSALASAASEALTREGSGCAGTRSARESGATVRQSRHPRSRLAPFAASAKSACRVPPCWSLRCAALFKSTSEEKNRTQAWVVSDPVADVSEGAFCHLPSR